MNALGGGLTVGKESIFGSTLNLLEEEHLEINFPISFLLPDTRISQFISLS